MKKPSLASFGFALTLGICSVTAAVTSLKTPLLKASAEGPAASCQTSIQRDPELEQQIDAFIRAASSGSALRKSVATKRIRERVFGFVGTSCYEDSLRQIDRRSAQNPTAMYDLARTLQLHWEARYAVGLGQRKSVRVQNGTKIGAMIGMAAFGASLFFRPSAAPRYFKIIRHLFPLIGVGAGHGGAIALNESGMLEKGIPISPAHVMRLGIQSDEFELDDSGLTRELAALTASVAAAGIAYDVLLAVKVFRTINVAATPIKVHPVALVGSLVVGFLVEDGVGRVIDYYQYSRLLSELQADRARFDAAVASGNDLQVLDYGERMVRRALALSAYLNTPIIEAIQNFNQETAAASQKYAPGSSRLDAALREATDDLKEAIDEALADRPYDRDSAYETEVVLGFLRNHDETSIASLSELAQDRSHLILRSFNRYVAQHESDATVCYDQSPRERLFQEFIDGFTAAESRRLARELRSGVVRKESKHILLQVLGTLRASGKDFLQDQADFVSTLVNRDDLLTSTSTGRALSP